jgi:tRNA A-37 threonylcarbamoyl transferase component Bud32
MTVDENTSQSIQPAVEDDVGSPLPPAVRRGRRRRRPSGAAPPLPRSIGTTGKVWLAASAVLVSWCIVTALSDAVRRVTDRADAAVLRGIASMRTDWLTDVMQAIGRVGSGWLVSVVMVGLLLALIMCKRWRHLFTFLGSFVLLAFIGGDNLYELYSRPRPYDVTTIDRWAGWSLPGAPVAVVAFLGLGIAYSLVVAGRSRQIAKVVTAIVVALFAFSQLYLATYHPFDLIIGISLSTAISVNAFRYFTPADAFPVAYRGGKTAHLDIGGRRGEALTEAIRDQLGLTVVDVKPVGLEGSGGSTPLRIRIAGDPDTYLFGKLYAMSHVRSDRWYKLGRTILYGRLEDEAPFQSVRRLVEYEDYTARLLRDVGIPTANSHGIVEMTPEREYLLVTDFFEGSQEIGTADLDDDLIDQALQIIRRLWDAGLAHRDIKPANLLVKDGQVILIDVAFVQVRPSPWRQAVDLANMMLVLAVRTDPERVYRHALRYFTEDDIAEAFAATRGVASPTQLRMALKQDGRDLLARFRALAPHRRPIALQRWNVRRVAYALGLAVAAVLVLNFLSGLVSPTYDLQVVDRPNCGTDSVMILMAQSVPSATAVPCIATVPAGWSFGGIEVKRGQSRFWLDSDTAGDGAVRATLSPRDECSVADATQVPSDELGMRRYERPEQLPPSLQSTRYYLFPGGCVMYEFRFDSDATSALLFDAESALAFQPRAELVEEVRSRNGLRLCGAGTDCVGDG